MKQASIFTEMVPNFVEISQLFTVFRRYLIILINSTKFREIPIKIGTKIDEF